MNTQIPFPTSSRTCDSRHCGLQPVIEISTSEPQQRIARLCLRCRRDLTADLTVLSKAYVACESALVRNGPRSLDKVRTTRGMGIVLDAEVVELRHSIVRLLTAVAARIARDLDLSLPIDRDVEALAQFVREHRDDVAAHPAAGRIRDAIHRLAESARRVAHQEPDEYRRQLGQCQHEGCDQAVFATRGDPSASTALKVTCEAGHIWAPHQWLALAQPLGDDVTVAGESHGTPSG